MGAEKKTRQNREPSMRKGAQAIHWLLALATVASALTRLLRAINDFWSTR
jgi:hypothetical protein